MATYVCTWSGEDPDYSCADGIGGKACEGGWVVVLWASEAILYTKADLACQVWVPERCRPSVTGDLADTQPLPTQRALPAT